MDRIACEILEQDVDDDDTRIVLEDFSVLSLKQLKQLVECVESPFCKALQEDTLHCIVSMLWAMKNNMCFSLAEFWYRPREDGVVLVALTSGSSNGQPKPVEVMESCLLPCVQHWKTLFEPSDCVLLVTSHRFDPFVCDVLGALLAGATLLIPPKPVANFSLLHNWLKKNPLSSRAVSVLHCTPSFVLGMDRQCRSMILRNLRQLGMGGETPPRCANQIYSVFESDGGGDRGSVDVAPPFKCLSFYGATELSVWTSVAHLYRNGDCSHRCIGQPIPETFVWLSPTSDQIVMSRGGTMFQSNDLGKKCSSCGSIEMIGRADRVQKRFGQMLDLAYLEKQALQLDARVLQAHCMLIEEVLVLFVHAEENTPKKDLKVALKKRLKVDRVVVFVDKGFPVKQSNGKVDSDGLVAEYQKRINVSKGVLQNAKDIEMLLHRRGVEESSMALVEQGWSSVDIFMLCKEISNQSCVAVEEVLASLYNRSVADACVEISKWMGKTRTTNVPKNALELWSVKTRKCVDGRGLMSNGRLYFGCHDGSVYSVDPVSGSSERWMWFQSERIEVALSGDDVSICAVGNNGSVVCFLHATGELVRWSFIGSGRGVLHPWTEDRKDALVASSSGVFFKAGQLCNLSYSSAPIRGFKNDEAICVSENGHLSVFTRMKRVVQTILSGTQEVFQSAPLICNEYLFVSSITSLYVCKSYHAIQRIALSNCGFSRGVQMGWRESEVIVCGSRGMIRLFQGDVQYRPFPQQMHISTKACLTQMDHFLVGTDTGEMVLFKWSQDDEGRIVWQGINALFCEPIAAISNKVIFGTRDNSIECTKA